MFGDGLTVVSDNVTIRGLSIVNYVPLSGSSNAISVGNGANAVIAGNFIGVLPNGTVSAKPM